MKTEKSNLIILCLAIFFVQLATNLLTFGVITYASYNFPGLEKVSLTVFFGAVGSLLALVISNYLKRSIHQNFIFYSKTLAFTMLISSIGLSFLPQLQTLWLFSYLVYNISISLVTSTLLSSLHALGTDNLLKHNRYLQITSTAGVLLGVSISPFLSIGGRFQFILIVTLILSILTAATSLRYFSNVSIRLNSSQNDELNTRFDGNLYLLFYGIFLVWLLGGFFYTIEVPILKSRFSATPSEISLVFLLSVVTNLISLLVLNRKFSSKNLFVIFLVSSFFCVIIAPLYAFNSYKNLIPILVASYGAMNGIFNFSYSSIIQSKESPSLQRSGFLFVKFISNLGILISSITSYYLTIGDLPVLMIYVAFVGIIVFLFFYKKVYSFALGAFLGFFFLSLSVRGIEKISIQIPNLPQYNIPYKNLDSGSALVLSHVFDRLYSYDDKNFIKPILVKKQSWTNNYTKLVIDLDETKTFSNGEHLNAEIVRASLLETILDLKEKSTWAFGNIRGFPRFIEKKGELTGLKALSSSTIVFEFIEPTPLFIQYLTSPYFAISFKDPKNGKRLGTGKYSINTESSDRWELKLKKQEKGMPGSLVFRTQSPLPFDISFNAKEDDQLPSGYELKRYNYLQTVVLIFNTSDQKFKNANTRCGLSSILKDATKKSTYEWAPISIGLPFSWAISENIQQPPYVKSGKPISMTILYADSAAFFSTEKNKLLASKALERNVNLQFERLTIKSLVQRLHNASFEAVLLGYVPDFIHADSLLSPFIGTNQQFNFSRYSSQKVDALLKEAKLTEEKQKQNEIYKNVFSILNKDCSVTFLGTQKGLYRINSKFDLPEFSSLGYHYADFSGMRLKNEY